MAPAEAAFPERLRWKDAFLFPIDTLEARRDALIGGTLILLLLKRGSISAATIAAYLSPAAVFGGFAYHAYAKAAPALLTAASAAAFVLAVFTLPGCLTVYAVEGDAAVLRNPAEAFRRAWSRRRVYLRAWAIALASVSLSLVAGRADRVSVCQRLVVGRRGLCVHRRRLHRVLRLAQRASHLYAGELYAGFGVSSLTNDLTTVFFGVQAIALAALLWSARRTG